MAAKKFVVTGEQDTAFHSKFFDIWRQWRARVLDPETILPGLQLLGEGKRIILSDKEMPVSDWLSTILVRERQYHLAFFGREFDLTEFEQKLRSYGRKRIKEWQNLGLEPHFLPAVSLMPDDDYLGWRKKPNEWFFQNLVEGKIFRNINIQTARMAIACLEGISVLIDVRLKPAYDNGRQMYEHDNLLGPILEQLRKEGEIARFVDGPQSSRFGVSADEWEKAVKPALAGKLGLDANQIRLETVEEGNIIPQLYPDLPRKDDGQTNTWVWYEQYLTGGSRLLGGRFILGGVGIVCFDSSGNRHNERSVRPLAVM